MASRFCVLLLQKATSSSLKWVWEFHISCSVWIYFLAKTVGFKVLGENESYHIFNALFSSIYVLVNWQADSYIIIYISISILYIYYLECHIGGHNTKQKWCYETCYFYPSGGSFWQQRKSSFCLLLWFESTFATLFYWNFLYSVFLSLILLWNVFRSPFLL